MSRSKKAGRRIRIIKEKGGLNTGTVLPWEEVNKLIELIKKEGEVYHMARLICPKMNETPHFQITITKGSTSKVG